MTKTKGVRQFAGVTSADLQVFAQRFCNGLRDWSRHRKSYSRSSVASGSLASARRLASMLLIQLFSGLNCGVPNAAKATSLRVVRSTPSANGDVLVLVILLSRFKLHGATEAAAYVLTRRSSREHWCHC